MLYEQVKRLCDEKNLAITALARQLHLSPSAPDNWKKGSLPKVETVQKIAEYFDVSLDYLLYGGERQRNIMNLGKTDVSDVHGQNVIQWNTGGTVVTENSSGKFAELQGIDAAMMQVFVGLDMLDKSKLFQTACEMAEAQKK